MSLDDVKAALDTDGSVKDLLEHQLRQLDAQAQALRAQQDVLLRMLDRPTSGVDPAGLGKRGWT